jgi:hypothetical protein
VETLLTIVIHEGRNRQVRKMFEAIGHPVVRLRRVAIGPIRDAKLRPGDFRELSGDEVAALKRHAGAGAANQAVPGAPRAKPHGVPSRPAPHSRSERGPTRRTRTPNVRRRRG